jgi:tetratricopeptide (TPR) repeat protein
LINAAICYGIYRLQRKDKTVLTGFLFYVFTIGLVVQIVPSGYNVVAERYSYVPYIGIALAVGALYVYSQSAGVRSRNANRLMILFSAALIILSYRRAAEWKDLVSINRSIAEQNRESAYAQLSAGFQELNAGRIEEAMRHVEEAEAIDPENSDMHFLKAKVRYQLKDTRAALQSFQKAKQTGSKRIELDGILAVLFFESAAYDSAEVYFTRVILADTARTAANFTNRALCRFNLSRYEDAVSDYTEALSIDPSLGNARAERGVCYAKLGKKEEACADLQRAVAEGFVDYQPELQENCR